MLPVRVFTYKKYLHFMLKSDAFTLFIYDGDVRTYLRYLMSALNILEFTSEILILLF